MAADNKLTYVPPTRLPELTQNLIRSSHGHSTPSLKISCKSVQPFSRNVADKETNKETKKSSRNNTPHPVATGGGVIIENLLEGLHKNFFIYSTNSTNEDDWGIARTSFNTQSTEIAMAIHCTLRYTVRYRRHFTVVVLLVISRYYFG